MKQFYTLHSAPSSQSGVVLVIGLILLSLLSMLALSTTRNITLQEKVVFNNQERTQALPAAESATRQAWSLLKDKAYLPENFINNSQFNALYDLRSSDTVSGNKLSQAWNTVYKATAWPWNDNSKRAEIPNPIGHASAPQYIVGMHDYVERQGSEKQFCVPYSIVGAGQGNTTSTQVIVELQVIPKGSCFRDLIK